MGEHTGEFTPFFFQSHAGLRLPSSLKLSSSSIQKHSPQDVGRAQHGVYLQVNLCLRAHIHSLTHSCVHHPQGSIPHPGIVLQRQVRHQPFPGEGCCSRKPWVSYLCCLPCLVCSPDHLETGGGVASSPHLYLLLRISHSIEYTVGAPKASQDEGMNESLPFCSTHSVVQSCLTL